MKNNKIMMYKRELMSVLVMVPIRCRRAEVCASLVCRRYTMHRLHRVGVHQSLADEPRNHSKDLLGIRLLIAGHTC